MTGVWRHKPTGNRYLVLGVADDSNNINPREEPQVIYVSIDFNQGGTGRPFHHRGLAEFLERFTMISPQDGGNFIRGNRAFRGEP